MTNPDVMFIQRGQAERVTAYPHNPLLIRFAWLQLADLVTTLVFLHLGGAEGNPIDRFLMAHLGVFQGLAVAKIGAVMIAATMRPKQLRLANWVYAAVIVWNLAAIVGAL